MPFAAAISEHPLATHAVGEVVGQVLERLGGAPDVVVAFATGPFAGAFEDIAAAVHATLQPSALVGATAASVIGGSQEVELGPAIALFAARLPPSAGTPPVAIEVEGAGQLAGAEGTLVLLADPASFAAEAFLEEVAAVAPRLVVVGGLASSSGGARLAVDRRVRERGAVGLLLPAGLATHVVTSQGADPVGEPLVVTRASGQLIEEIAGQPALDRVLALADSADPHLRSRLARSLLVGVAVDERKVELERGDFLLHPVLGGDKERRAVAVGTAVEVGTTVQFHVRDAEAADADLRDLLVDAPGTAALVFTSAGRGQGLFGVADHDAAIVHEHVEGGATAGSFCAGEIGPVGGRARLLALSTSVLLFPA